MTEQPNILWICTDSQRYDTIAALGNCHISTPHLDRLCREGAACTRAYSQSPVCTPSRASFLTGRYPSSVRVPRNGNARFPGAAPLVTKTLADAGYECGLVGKLHLASAWTGRELRGEDGYTHVRYSHSPAQGIGTGNEYGEWLLAQGIDLSRVFQREPDGTCRRYQPDVPEELTQAWWCADRAVDYIRTRSRLPWLLSVNLFDPHPPFTPARNRRARYQPHELLQPRFGGDDLVLQRLLRDWPVFCPEAHAPGASEQEQIADYYAVIELIDEQVGRILAALDATGQRERTLVVFHSDHGELLGDHGLSHKGCRFYEGAVRVPLIWSWPGHIRPGTILDEEVGLIDIAPTLLEAVGIAAVGMHGESLASALGGAPLPLRFQPLRCEYHNAVNFSFPVPSLYPPAAATMLVEGRRKLVIYHGGDHGELYDLNADPDEVRNRWSDPDQAETRARLIRRCFDATVMALDTGEPLIGRY